jgi:hypothetical protein
MRQPIINVVKTFPSISLNTPSGLAIEASLIAQLGHGAGNSVYESVLARQQHHPSFVDELNEPSVKLGGVNTQQNDFTSLYSFIVGPEGHPFHRHAGHRVFTAIAGSGGAQLRFCTATTSQMQAEPLQFIQQLHCIHIPPDSLFTVRFGGETWHQFVPLSKHHPTFVALSCHTNELGGIQDAVLRQQVIDNLASIPSLTELLPANVQALLDAKDFNWSNINTTSLSLDAPAGTLHQLMCAIVRCSTGLFRGVVARLRHPVGYIRSSQQSNIKK